MYNINYRNVRSVRNGINNLVVSTFEMSVVDRDIRLAVNRSVIYFERTKLAEFINQL